jgi:fucose 4-O-acetylase-like acetyltransferase
MILASVGVLFDVLQIHAPLYLDSALTALPFFYIGHLLRNSFVLRNSEHSGLQATVSCAMIAFLVLIPRIIGESKIVFVDNHIEGNVLIAYLSSFFGVMALLLICKKVKWLPMFSYLGRYSIIVLCVHQLFIYPMANIRMLHVQNHHFAIFAITLLFSWLAIPICKRYIPWFVAQKDIIHLNETIK